MPGGVSLAPVSGASRPASPAPSKAPLPEGTLPVGAGLIVAGVASFAFFKIGQLALGAEAFKPVMALWFVTFTLVPGFFIPVEQELGRALADRRARAVGGRPVVRRIVVLAGALCIGLLAAVAAASGWFTEEMFEHHGSVTAALLVVIVAYAVTHVARGITSGSGRFAAYGLILGVDSAVRIGACTILWLAGVDAIGAYALAVALSPVVAVGVAATRGDLATSDGPATTFAAVTPNLGWLLVGSLMSAALVNAGPLGVDLLADPGEAARVTAFGNGVILARIPLFLFQAIQAALLPRLARLAAEGDMDEFRSGFSRLMVVVGGVALAGTAGAWAVGPAVLDLMYSSELDRRTLGLLAASSGLFMLAQAVAQAVIALRGHRMVGIGWLTGTAVFVATAAFSSEDLYLRVEIGLVAGCATAFLAFGASLGARLRAGLDPDLGHIAAGVVDHPLEG